MAKSQSGLFGTGKNRESDVDELSCRAGNRLDNLRKTPKPLKTRYPAAKKNFFAFPGCAFVQEAAALYDDRKGTGRPLTALRSVPRYVGSKHEKPIGLVVQFGGNRVSICCSMDHFFLRQAWCRVGRYISICYVLGAFFGDLLSYSHLVARKEGRTQSCSGDLIGLFCVTAPLYRTVFWRELLLHAVLIRIRDKSQVLASCKSSLSEKALILRVHN